MENTHKFLNMMMSALFIAEERRLQKVVDNLHNQNQEATKSSLDGFLFQGKFYAHSQSARGSGKRLTLHLSLWDQMELYLRDSNQVELDKQLIRQALFRQIHNCLNEDELRDAIPDCIVDTLPPHISMRQRCHDTGFFLNNLSDIRQFAEALPRIEFYSASRLIY